MPDSRTVFPRIPCGWYYMGRSADLRPGPSGVTVGPRQYVGFRETTGSVSVLDARCAHMGANLSLGHVADGQLHCPLHDWHYDGLGRCVRIAAAAEIPAFACQAAYPTAEFGGHIAFFNGPVAAFDMPFYDGVTADQLLPATPFDFIVDTPWYMIGANAFDLQHFRIAHDRTLVDEPLVESPSPFARRITASYDVTGKGWRDELTRRISGPRVRMAVTVWAGTNILVTATFARTTSYGMVFVRPLSETQTHLRTIVWVSRRRGALARAIADPLDAFIRRRFIRAFMADDATRSNGVRYNPATFIAADQTMADYFDWLRAISNGVAGDGDASTTRSA